MMPAWQVNPKSRMCSPEIRAAYKARTLCLLTLESKYGHDGYAWTTSRAEAEKHAERIRQRPPMGCTGNVTVAPYPYHREA